LSKINENIQRNIPETLWAKLKTTPGGVLMSCDDDWFEDDAYNDVDREMDEFQQALDDCGEMGHGRCSLAGTEHCDFRCPFRKGL
jgi:hypothetical protein